MHSPSLWACLVPWPTGQCQSEKFGLFDERWDWDATVVVQGVDVGVSEVST
jgi:hypothetical protein